jgi:hypothetical protein
MAGNIDLQVVDVVLVTLKKEYKQNMSGWRGPEDQRSNGRPKGSPNKVTMEIREAYQRLVEGNLENMTTWLTQVAADDPEKAFDLMIKLSEYVIPKLARQEVTGADGEDLFKNVKFEFGPDINDQIERED